MVADHVDFNSMGGVIKGFSKKPVAGFQIEMSTSLSRSHIRMAKLFADMATSYDKPELFSNFHQSAMTLLEGFSLSAVILSVAFLEANINELYCDIDELKNKDRYLDGYDNLPQERLSAIATLWSNGIPKTAAYPILAKYEHFLNMLSVPKMDKGSRINQDVQLLINLRNQLVHYESEWNISSDQNTSPLDKKNRTVSQIFQDKFSGRFEENLYNKKSSNPFFPSKCLGSGCARWAVESSLLFTDEFYKRINIEPPYESMRLDITF